MSLSEEHLIHLQQEVARIRERKCSLCGFTSAQHEAFAWKLRVGIIPDEEPLEDPAAFPCDEFQEEES